LISDFNRAQLNKRIPDNNFKMNASAFTTEQTRMIDALKSTGADTEAIEKHFAGLNQRIGDLAAPETLLTAEEEAELSALQDEEEGSNWTEEEFQAAEAMLNAARNTVPASLLLESTNTKRRRGAPKGPRNAPEPECRCMARIAGTGHEQCKNTRHTDHGEFCARHGKQHAKNPVPLQFDENGKKEGLFFGRIDNERPQVDQQGRICVVYEGDQLSGDVHWHPALPQAKKALRKEMREVSNARKQAEKDAKKAERQAKKEAKAAERLTEKEAKDEARAQKKTEKSTEAKKARFLAKKARKKSANGFLAFRAAFLQTQLSISKPDGSKVRAGEVSKLAGAQWKTMPAESKAIWTQVAAQKLEQAQKAEEAKTHELDHLSTLLLHA
tara:strand:+ start:3316 stop:4467 length:1152 start_codon:yes stop_codon:yes gene_type:complete